MDHVRTEASFPKPKNLFSERHLLHMVSHELRTPFAVIQSSAELLRMMERGAATPGTDQVSQYAGNILEEVAHVTDILNRMIQFSELQSRNIRQNCELLDAGELAKRVLSRYFSPWKDGRNAELLTSGPPRLVASDSGTLSQVIRNLVENAFKYSSGRRAPVVRLKFLPDSWCVTVRDFGIGIPERDQARLFRPFSRASNVGDVPGTGLGLVTVMQLVKGLEGRLRIWSIEDKGTMAIVTFGSEEGEDD